jgi:hypothetical protein
MVLLPHGHFNNRYAGTVEVGTERRSFEFRCCPFQMTVQNGEGLTAV